MFCCWVSRFTLKAIFVSCFHFCLSLNDNNNVSFRRFSYLYKMAKNNRIPTERFLDVSNEPQRRPTPIEGYELKSLVSLEEAVRPLESIISNIQAFVWTATGNCENPKDGLTSNESAAIYLYTMECMYRQLNAALRSENRQQLTVYFSYLKLLLTALWKLDNMNTVVWRGVKGNIADQYSEGKKFAWWGLSSCTSALSVLQADTFLGETGPRTIFNIQCFNGKMIQNHSQFPNESEVLLLPCSYFEVMGIIKQGSNLHIIHIQQIEPPVALIQPPSPSFALSPSLQNMAKPTTMVKLHCLKNKPRLSIDVHANRPAIFANEKYLLFHSSDGLQLIDEQGHTKLNIEPEFGIIDLCWSSYLNQFLILSESYAGSCLHSLEVKKNNTHQVIQIKKFPEERRSCACFNQTFLACSPNQGEGCIIEEYDQSNWKLKKVFKPPMSCPTDQAIVHIRFSSNGTHLGVLLGEENRQVIGYRFWFELRTPHDMNVLQITEIGSDRNCWLLSLPNEQFLTSLARENKFYLIDSTGKLNETIDYHGRTQRIVSTALINGKCLVVHTDDRNQLHFYDL